MTKIPIRTVFITLVFILANNSQLYSTIPAPANLTCELIEHPERTLITDSEPEFGWVVNSDSKGDCQTAYQILVATSPDKLNNETGDMWDTGKVRTNESINVEYKGKAIASNSVYYWKIRTWNRDDVVSPYSAAQMFQTGSLTGEYSTARYPLEKREVKPIKIVQKRKGHYFVDFGRAAFGTVRLNLKNVIAGQEMAIHLAEALKAENTIDPEPGGSIRYRKMIITPEPVDSLVTVLITPDERNTRARASKMPDYIGEVMPFRYCEVVNCPTDLDQTSITQLVVNYPFNDNASSFTSSDPILNDVWELCKYSIKATSFCGVYVDGDRERIPYEADAYINQLCHYQVDREYSLARYSHEYLITHPTWPTEWILHSVLMAWADYLYTGNKESIAHFYDALGAKTLMALSGEDGLISTRTGLVTDDLLKSIHFQGDLKDIVDWPPASFTRSGKGEQDGYVFTDINTVVNAFHYQALVLMAQISHALDKTNEANFYRKRAERVKSAINRTLFDKNRTIYVDGLGTGHASLHANMMPLAFGIVPEEYIKSVVAFIKSRGMACSVYGAQYLLEALYQAGEDTYALALMTAHSDRSWPHMIYEVGSTITLEAWDKKYKENLDWNHAWGAAPANIIPRWLMGIQPLEPGFGKFQVKPQVGHLKHGSISVPTIRGTIQVRFNNDIPSSFQLNVTVPTNTTAKVYLPKFDNNNPWIKVDDVEQKGVFAGDFVVLEIKSGNYKLERKKK